METGENLRSIIRAVRNLPTLPAVAIKINKLIHSANYDVSQLAGIIEMDPSLAARILSLANSAFYSLARKIKSIQDAVIYMGTNTISQLVVSLGIINTFKTREKRNFNRKEFWLHCIAVGLAAKEIAKSLRHDHPDDVFTAALLHDMGKVVMDEYCPDIFADILEKTGKENLPFYAVEQKYLGIDHCRVGEWVARNWELPLLIIVGIRHHHEDPEKRKGFNLSHDRIVDIIRAADWAVLKKNIGHSGSVFIEDPPEEVFGRISHGREEVLRHAESIAGDVHGAALLLDVE